MCYPVGEWNKKNHRSDLTYQVSKVRSILSGGILLGDSTGPSVEFPSTKKKVKIFKWKKLV